MMQPLRPRMLHKKKVSMAPKSEPKFQVAMTAPLMVLERAGIS